MGSIKSLLFLEEGVSLEGFQYGNETLLGTRRGIRVGFLSETMQTRRGRRTYFKY